MDEQPMIRLGLDAARGMRQNVVVCDTQPVTAEGLRYLLAGRDDLAFFGSVHSLAEALEAAQAAAPAVLVLDKAFGTRALLECLTALRAAEPLTASVIWGVSLTEPEVLRFIQAGARGVLRKSADLESVVSCLEAAAGGTTWMEQSLRGRRRWLGESRGLTPREQQVYELAGQGLKNREIAGELGIRTGTVKVHLKHIFEKTGAQGRYGLALAVLTAGQRQ